MGGSSAAPALRGGWVEIAVAAAAAIAVASIGGALTELGPWYEALEKPWWQPPDAAFPIAWTLIFALTAAAGVFGWRATEPAGRATLLIAFAANAALNVLWSGLFFGLQRPDWALIEVGFLLGSIVVLILLLRRRSAAATALLSPYLLWVGFAAVLNAEVARLNAPFGA